MDILKNIQSPDDLKKLQVNQLSDLADQIRSFMLSSVSKTGGHLASNLGVIELTLALHYTFDFKNDKLLWDVGHQCYTHKIITGRKDSFHLLRQVQGISGFPNPSESEYDLFTVGHAGTAIATAIGMALGQSHTKKENKIVAVVGDASIVNGLSFEALNNLGLVKRQLLIVLNDNSMAIDPTQGALAKYFAKMRLSHTYEDLVKTTNNILEHLPVIGKGVEDAIEKIKKGIRMVMQPSQIFESLNIPYFGPVDGHDIKSLVQLFDAIEHLEKPAILHVYTKKGKGFSPAEEQLTRYHSTGPFEMNGDIIETDASEAKTFTNAFGEHMVYLAERDPKIIAITSAMCDGTGLGKFRQRFPDRFYDVGIAESVAVDIAAGMAKCGCKPIVCIYSTFLQRSFDQIFQEVALQNLPVIFCIDRAGVVGADGATHHGMMDIGFMRMMPGVILTAPADLAEVKAALDFAVSVDKPVIIRYPKDIAPELLSDKSALPFELGKSVTCRTHPDAEIAIVTYGCVLSQALEAAEILSKEGTQIDVINARFAVPLDNAIISLLAQGKTLIIAEDHSIACGFGSAVLEAAAEHSDITLQKKIKLLAAPKEFIPHNSRKAQLTRIGISTDNIANTVRKLRVD